MFARTIGLPNDPVAAVELLAGGIDAGDLRPIGLGQVNGRFFCFHTGVGTTPPSCARSSGGRR